MLYQANCTTLPPWAQQAREELAIFEDERLSDLLGAEAVQKLRHRLPGYSLTPDLEGYIILAEGRKIHVYVTYLPKQSGLLGPVDFELYFLPE